MNILSDFYLGPKRVILQTYGKSGYSVRCCNYKSLHYRSDYKNMYDYSDYSYTLLHSDNLLVALDAYVDEVDYLMRLYKDGLQSSFFGSKFLG